VYELFSEGELVGILNELKAELIAQVRGERYVTLSSGGKSFSRQVRTYDVLTRQIGDVQTALQAKNPLKYGSPTNKTFTYFGGYQWK
jgi:hypothetical protein